MFFVKQLEKLLENAVERTGVDPEHSGFQIIWKWFLERFSFK
jgi:hypothetical protein